MHVIGLTGGIASGKSTVADSLRRRGLPVVDADQLARDVVMPGEPALEAVVAAFGPGVLAGDGTLDRRALGKVVFDDPAKRKRLEAILHPAIAIRGQQALGQLRQAGYEMAFYEAALLVETGTWRAMSALVVVSAPAWLQRERVLARDPDLSAADADARIAAQMPLAKKEAAADFVVENDGTRSALEARIDEVLERLREKLDG